jgi:hypothetical protein
MEMNMPLHRPKNTERVGLMLDPQMRAVIEAEAARRDASMSGVIRTMLRDQIAALSAPNSQAGAR